ncbi:MAG TPA: prenyltransferase/squalene oxidase repeat-containing protein [Planctomycetota bacterium]|nr:prenyltransferase/squalene oxidase repeat-containing protein [Planctomycetota bacterium]
MTRGAVLLSACALAGPLLAAEARPNALRELYAKRTKEGRALCIGGAGGTTAEAEAAVDAGLAWLAKAQEPDGRWSTKNWGGAEGYDLGITGLALLAFAGAGHGPGIGDHQATVAKGLAWLRSQQFPNGGFAWKVFYEEGMAALALCEASGVSQDPELTRAAQLALDYLCKIQPEHGGFRYQGAAPKEQGDLSVSGWQFLALAQGLSADHGLPQAALGRSRTLLVPQSAIERARVLLKNTYCGDGGSSYVAGQKTATPSMTAIGMFCRQLFGDETAGPEIRAAADWLLKRAAKAKDGKEGMHQLAQDFYFTHHSCLAMYQMGGRYWTTWNALFRDAVAKAQVQEEADAQGRPLRGSWDPAKHAFGQAGGRVYITAMAVMCLETYYRYAPFYRGRLPLGTEF